MNESEYYRRETGDSIRDYAQSRLDFAAEQIIDAFDWKDARDAIELAGEKAPLSYEAFCEALAAFQHIPTSQIEDRRVRDLAIALDKVARFYAGHRAAMEDV
jgi:hypothetical protein